MSVLMKLFSKSLSSVSLAAIGKPTFILPSSTRLCHSSTTTGSIALTSYNISSTLITKLGGLDLSRPRV
jgi:hypothetical protein